MAIATPISLGVYHGPFRIARPLLGVETAIDPFTTVFLHKGIVNFRIQEWKWFNTTSTDPYHSNFAIQSSRKRVCQNQAAKSSDKRHLEWINRYKYYMIYHYVHMNSQFLTEKWYKALTNHHASLAKKNNSMWHLHREKTKRPSDSPAKRVQLPSWSWPMLLRVQIRLMVQKSGDHQLIWKISLFLQGLIHPRWCKMSSINSISAEVQIHVENINHLSGYTRSLISLQR